MWIKIKNRSVFLTTISELLVNISAGWFGAAIIVPAFSDKPPTFNLFLVTFDLIFGIICLSSAYKLKVLAKKRGL